jgi:hypothetical protein
MAHRFDIFHHCTIRFMQLLQQDKTQTQLVVKWLMDNDTALKIINALASGVDPFTGEVFSDGSTLQHPDVVRALFLAAMALQKTNDKKAKRSSSKNCDLPSNSGTSWSEAEDHKLVAAFESGSTEKELAAVHQRTLGAIHSRLVKLGKLQPDWNVAPKNAFQPTSGTP